MAALAERIEGVVAVDGKTARRSFDRQGGQGPLHLISAFACDTRLALGQRKVDGKSNEISALGGPGLEYNELRAKSGVLYSANAKCSDLSLRWLGIFGADLAVADSASH